MDGWHFIRSCPACGRATFAPSLEGLSPKCLRCRRPPPELTRCREPSLGWDGITRPSEHRSGVGGLESDEGEALPLDPGDAPFG